MTPEERYRSSFMRSLAAVKEAVPLEEYAATLTDLETFGRGWWTGRCPLPDHEDRTPSFYVYPAGAGEAAAHAHCYGCNFHGDIFDLFQSCEGGELWEAMIEISRRFDVEMPKRPPSWFAKQKRQRPVRDAIGRARFDRLRRRLFRVFFAPSLARIEDRDERRGEAEAFWAATDPLARLLIGRLGGGR